MGECGNHVGCYVYDGSCHSNPKTGTPVPTVSPNCGGSDQPAGCSCQTDDQCASGVCSFAHCVSGCGGFGEAECWTHANCHFANGACQNGAAPSPGSGSCEIVCTANRSGVSVSAKAGIDPNACKDAVVTASWFSKVCPVNTGVCGGPSTTSTSTLPFTENISGSACGSWQSDIAAGTNKGGSCRAADSGVEPCSTNPPTPTSTPPPPGTPTPTPAPSLTPSPTSTPNPTPTPTPTPVTGCYQECSSLTCSDGLSCQEINGTKRCVNSACSGETDCTCNKSCWNICSNDNECPQDLRCLQVGSDKHCVNVSCQNEQDCSCESISTKPPVLGAQTPVVTPKAGAETNLTVSLLLIGAMGVVIRLGLLLI